jgi:hypothetical protein
MSPIAPEAADVLRPPWTTVASGLSFFSDVDDGRLLLNRFELHQVTRFHPWTNCLSSFPRLGTFEV